MPIEMVEAATISESGLMAVISAFVKANVETAKQFDTLKEVAENYGEAMMYAVVSTKLGSREIGPVMHKCLDLNLWALHCYELWSKLRDGKDINQPTSAERIVDMLLAIHRGDLSESAIGDLVGSMAIRARLSDAPIMLAPDASCPQQRMDRTLENAKLLAAKASFALGESGEAA